jgi:hypothetical protein
MGKIELTPRLIFRSLPNAAHVAPPLIFTHRNSA